MLYMKKRFFLLLEKIVSKKLKLWLFLCLRLSLRVCTILMNIKNPISRQILPR